MRHAPIGEGLLPPRLGRRRLSSAHLGFPATEAGVRLALLKLRRELQALDLPPPAVETAELVLGEVLNNIAEHAYVGRRQGIVRLTLRRSGRWLVFSVADQGRPLPGLALPSGLAPSVGGDLACLPEGGFGWFLIRHLARNLSYRRQGGSNLLDFRIRLSGCCHDAPGAA